MPGPATGAGRVLKLEVRRKTGSTGAPSNRRSASPSSIAPFRIARTSR